MNENDSTDKMEIAGEKENDGILKWLKENIEAVIIAFVMALVIKCFCIEVFKIPTGSMEPTLHGDPVSGDRIMVNKFYYNLDPIKRFDVIIFRYPLETTKTYIKRVAGLPNEKIMVSEGDLYFNPDNDGQETFFLAKKPFELQQKIWIPVHENAFVDLVEIGKEWNFDKSACSLLTDEKGRTTGLLFKTAGTAGKSSLLFASKIHDSLNSPLVSGNRVQDFKLAFSAVMQSDTGSIFASISDGANAFEVKLDSQGNSMITHSREPMGRGENAPSETPIDFKPVKNEKISLEIMKFDGAFHLLCNGRELCKLDYKDKYAPETFPAEQRISFGTINSDCLFNRVSVYRDLYYTAQGNLQQTMTGMPKAMQIPENSYYMLGDNSLSSKDSRAWEEVVIKLKNGSTLTGDTQRDSFEGDGKIDNPIIRNKEIIFRDVYGCDHSIEKSAIADFDPYNIPTRQHPFVTKDEIVGKAFAVWWPPKRAKLIR
ncbi:MAG: signal peptidase I [Planctomycetes bacterium]|nr:signal peptidase I [Planctomycetota bacterium]